LQTFIHPLQGEKERKMDKVIRSLLGILLVVSFFLPARSNTASARLDSSQIKI